MLYWDDVSDSFDGWMNLLRQLGGDSFINFEQDIWETRNAVIHPTLLVSTHYGIWWAMAKS